ncbi:MAG: polysaccharide biosynthesis/export family protein [Bacteroidales bacterium]
MTKNVAATCLFTLMALAPLAAQSPQQAAPPTPPPQQAGAQGATAAAVPVGTSGTTEAATASANGLDYRLGAGDKIRVEVYKEPQLSQSLQVRPDGKITMPWIGDMTAAGSTPTQLRDQIGTALKEYVNNPVVTVMVVEALASTVYVMGEVNKPGTLALTGPTTVLQALAMAGGFHDFAKTSKIKVLRAGPNGQQTIMFNYDKAVKGEVPAVYLQRGDTIIVP